MEQNKGILINEDLFSTKLDEYATKDLEYINVPDSVGIATEYTNEKKVYIVYLNNELGNNIYNKTINGFIKAVIIAREMYEAIKFCHEGITKAYVQINKQR